MGYLYKLVDKKEIELANDGLISLSHPIFEFKGSEGEIISFAKRIYDRYKKQGLKVKPSDKDLEEIAQWIEMFKVTYQKGACLEGILSDAMIMFCGIMQGLCGYFTTINLFDTDNLKLYLDKNKLKKKIGVIRLDDSTFKTHHWRSSELDKPFEPFVGDSNDLRDYNGFTHPTKINYNEHYDDYNELLKIYNKDDVRKASNWFNNLPKQFEWQQEKRIIFLLRSLEKNSSRIGCDSVYKIDKTSINYQEFVFCKIIDAIDYCQKCPRFICLNVGKAKLTSFKIDDILKNNFYT